jgi:hypothetical protein
MLRIGAAVSTQLMYLYNRQPGRGNIIFIRKALLIASTPSTSTGGAAASGGLGNWEMTDGAIDESKDRGHQIDTSR